MLQLDELGGKKQILGGVIRNVVGDGIVPNVLFGGSENGFSLRRSVQSWSGGLGTFVRPRGGGSQSGFVIERVMKIDPEPAVKLEDGKRPVREIVLLLGCRTNAGGARKAHQDKMGSPSR